MGGRSVGAAREGGGAGGGESGRKEEGRREGEDDKEDRMRVVVIVMVIIVVVTVLLYWGELVQGQIAKQGKRGGGGVRGREESGDKDKKRAGNYDGVDGENESCVV